VTIHALWLKTTSRSLRHGDYRVKYYKGAASCSPCSILLPWKHFKSHCIMVLQTTGPDGWVKYFVSSCSQSHVTLRLHCHYITPRCTFPCTQILLVTTQQQLLYWHSHAVLYLLPGHVILYPVHPKASQAHSPPEPRTSPR
jgi:hypothetical protein